jgi:tetratricopeptide (TPR) repeat protein
VTVRVVALVVALVLLPLVRGAGADSVGEIEDALDAAVSRYDLAGAIAAQSDARTQHREDGDPAVADLLVRASLAVAELLRIDFEEWPEGDRDGRRTTGTRIDVAAEEGLAVLETLPETSDNARRRADLIATKIRSDFRAKKFRDDFDRAVARSLELDPSNARAWVAKAKPYLFASPQHGGDVDEAVRLLSHALELETGLESARLLRAEAYARLGDNDAAAADWRAALEKNPHCAPARRRLEGGKDSP